MCNANLKKLIYLDEIEEEINLIYIQKKVTTFAIIV